MSPADRIRLRHMIDAIEAAQRFVAGRSRADLDSDEMLRLALVQAVQIVGEAANRVTADGQAALPGIDWPVIVGMRNRLVHAYFDIDHDILWSTVQHGLPPLLTQLKAVPPADPEADIP